MNLRAPAHPFVEPVLHRHLHGDLDGDGTGLGKEHAVEAGQQPGEPARQRERALMGEAAEHHVGHDVELALHRRGDGGMVIAVAGGPPRGDAVDELPPVGEHDAAAARRHHRQRRRRGLHLRIGQPDVGQIEPSRRLGRTGGVFFARIGVHPVGLHVCEFARRAAPRSRRDGKQFAPRIDAGTVLAFIAEMSSLDDFANAKLAGLEREHLRRALVTSARRDVVVERDGRRLVSFSCNDYLGLSHHPALKDAARDGNRAIRRRRRRLAPRHREPSALRGAGDAARASQGNRGGLRVRFRLSRQHRDHSGAGRPRRPRADRRARPCLPVGRRPPVRRDRRAVRPQQPRRSARAAARAPRRPRAHADPHRRRLFDGRRPRPPPRAGPPRARIPGLADGGRCPWHRRHRARPRLELRRRNCRRRAAADGDAVEGGRRLWRLSLRVDAGRSSS